MNSIRFNEDFFVSKDGKWHILRLINGKLQRMDRPRFKILCKQYSDLVPRATSITFWLMNVVQSMSANRIIKSEPRNMLTHWRLLLHFHFSFSLMNVESSRPYCRQVGNFWTGSPMTIYLLILEFNDVLSCMSGLVT